MNTTHDGSKQVSGTTDSRISNVAPNAERVSKNKNTGVLLAKHGPVSLQRSDRYDSSLTTKTPKIQKRYMKILTNKRFTFAGSLAALVVMVVFGLIYKAIPRSVVTTSVATSVSVVHAWGSDNLEVWWPVDQASVSGTQPFKAMVKNIGIDAYTMFWQVDGGQKNEMQNSFADYPHKEYMVDLTGWTWKGSGPYTITFSAFDKNGQSLGDQHVVLMVNSSTASSQQGQVPVSDPVPAKLVVAVADVAPQAAQLPLGKLDVWWPSPNANVSGTQPFKAMLENHSVSDYDMFWQVDGGTLNKMDSSFQDYPHKEVLVDLSGWTWKGPGPYTINFVAKDFGGNVLGQNSVPITVGNVSPVPQPVRTAVVPTDALPVTPSLNQSALSGAKLYVNPYNEVKLYANSIRSYDSYRASLLDKIANQPETSWMGGWNTNVQADTDRVVSDAASQGAVPVLVVYNIPQRDCGGYSAGGISPDNYRKWVQSMAAGIGKRKATVILEPDALTLTDCLNQQDLQTRYSLISEAVGTFKNLGNTSVYLDAGHPGWIPAGDMASRLKQAGIDRADGFALNVSNFVSTADNINYGQNISNQLGGKHFVIDTGRNGSGPAPDYQWCNPNGRSLGQRPTTSTGNNLVDAFLWVKGPGGSDGLCNGGPSAGVFWPDYAIGLAQRTSW